jgi:hypothetical protein
MKRLLLVMLLILVSRPAIAEWIALDSPYQTPGLRTVYIDPVTIRPEGQLVTLIELRDYRSGQGGLVGRRFLSATSQKQFDCPAQRYRLLAYTDFAGPMGTGNAEIGAVDPDTWHTIEADSMNQTLWEMACKTPLMTRPKR